MFAGCCFDAACTRAPLEADVSPGTIVIRTGERRLYYVTGDGTAVRYPVAVGRADRQWTGRVYVDGKHVRPAWLPPWDVKRDNPRVPRYHPGGGAE